MGFICDFLMLVGVAGMVLSFIGRQTFILHTGTGTYENAIYAEEDHDRHFRGPSVSMKDIVSVTAVDGNKVDVITQIGLSVMYAADVVPWIVSLWLLSRVLKSIRSGEIFTERNVAFLMYSGLLLIWAAILVPFVKLFVGYLANQFTDSVISIGLNPVNNIVRSFGLFLVVYVVAYVIHCGRRLQDAGDSSI